MTDQEIPNPEVWCSVLEDEHLWRDGFCASCGRKYVKHHTRHRERTMITTKRDFAECRHCGNLIRRCDCGLRHEHWQDAESPLGRGRAYCPGYGAPRHEPATPDTGSTT